MKTKEIIKNALCEESGYVSGEELAEKLGISRAAVCNAVKELNKEGIKTKAVTNRGYMLVNGEDIVSESGIKKYLKTGGLKFIIADKVFSTNSKLKEFGEKGEPEGLIMIADEQEKGKGRFDRKFYSPKGGIYMSVLLRPKTEPSQAVSITTAMAVAVCRAVDSAANVETKIKWVNDIFLNNKKVCGILTEAVLGMEAGGVDYAVIGLGINVYEPIGGFSKEISGVAGAISSGEKIDKNKLIAAVLDNFFIYYYKLPEKIYAEEYVKRSMVLGEKILVLKNGNARKAVAEALDGDLRLKVKYENGDEQFLDSGEISVKI